jgi:hypothetical protein
MPKKTNPLYVVTNKGKDVQEVESLFDAFVKKLHLQPFVDLFMDVWLQIIEQLTEMVTNYSMFMVVKSMIDEWVEKILDLAQKLGVKTA